MLTRIIVSIQFTLYVLQLPLLLLRPFSFKDSMLTVLFMSFLLSLVSLSFSLVYIFWIQLHVALAPRMKLLRKKRMNNDYWMNLDLKMLLVYTTCTTMTRTWRKDWSIVEKVDNVFDKRTIDHSILSYIQTHASTCPLPFISSIPLSCTIFSLPLFPFSSALPFDILYIRKDIWSHRCLFMHTLYKRYSWRIYETLWSM